MKYSLLGQAMVLSGVVWHHSMGYAGEPSERMEELKAVYQEELKKVTAPVDRQYEKALINLTLLGCFP